MQANEQIYQQASMQMSQEFAREFNAALHAQVQDTSTDNGDKRSAPRRRALKAGMISMNNGNITLPCLVRDISDTGAKIRTDVNRHPSDSFTLSIDLDGLVAHCEVVWREGQQLGVRFTSAPQISAPTRTQVVYAPEDRQRKSLLRKQLS